MTDLRTAAQQALEALEKLVVGSEYEEAVEAERAIDALKAALEQQAEPVDTDCHTQGICQRSGYGVTQQPEPVKPVAWVHTDAYSPKVRFLEWTQQPRGYRGDWIKTPLCNCAQPQRKPLTDEDILRVLMLDPPNPSLWPHLKGEAIVGDVQQAVLAIVRAVERALEEKNRGR